MKSYIVLSAEDSDSDFLLIQLAVERCAPCQLCRVLNGEEALSFLLRADGYVDAPRPDFILLDGAMPRKNGFQVLEEIQQHDSLRDIPVVMLTSSRSSRDQERALSLGATDFLTKSSDLDEFVTKLSQHLPALSGNFSSNYKEPASRKKHGAGAAE